MAPISDAARRAAEARRKAEAERRAAEAAAKKAAEAAAKKAAEAATRKAADASAKKASATLGRVSTASARELSVKAGARPSASAVRQAFGKDELSQGLGRALRTRAKTGLGSPTPLAGTGEPAWSAAKLLAAVDASKTSAAMGPRTATSAPADAATRDAATVQKSWDDAKAAGKTDAEAAHAAAKTLDELTRAAKDPAAVDALVKAAAPTIERIADVAGRAADSRVDRDKNLMKDTMRRLATVADRGGDGAASTIAERLAAKLPNGTQLQEIDDALFEHMGAGGTTALARALHDELREAGKLEAAQGLADNEHGTDLELLVIDEARAALDGGMTPDAVYAKYGAYLETHVAESIQRHESEDSAKAVELLADLADRGGSALASRIGTSLAGRVPDDGNLQKLDDVLHDLAKNGRGLELTASLVSELSHLGKTKAVGELADVSQVALEKALGAHAEKQAAWANAEAQLGQQLAMYGGGMTDAERQKYVDAFWADPANKKVKDEFTASEARLGETFATTAPELERMALAGDGKARELLLKGAKALASSPGTAKQAIDFVERLGQPENKALFDALNVDGKLEDTLADEVLAPAIGAAQSKAVTDGSMDALVDQLKRLNKLRKNFQKIPGLVEGAIKSHETITKLLAEGKSGQEIMEALRFDKLTSGWESKSPLSKAMAVFTVVSSMVKAGQAEGGLEKLKASLSAVKGGLELTAGILGTFGRAGKLAGGEAAGKLIGKFLPYASLAIDGIQLGQDIQKLVNGGNAGDAIATVGTVINLVGDVCGIVPIAGTAVDGILTTVGSIVQGVGGLISGIIDGNEAREAREAAQRGYLEKAGVSPEIRDLLMGGALVDLSALSTMGLSRDQFLQVLRTQQNLPTNDDGKAAYAAQLAWGAAAAYGLKGDAAMRFVEDLQKQVVGLSWEDVGRLERALGDLSYLTQGATNDGYTPEETRRVIDERLQQLDWAMEGVLPGFFDKWGLGSKGADDVNLTFFTTYDQR